jgi:hypothetical protein
VNSVHESSTRAAASTDYFKEHKTPFSVTSNNYVVCIHFSLDIQQAGPALSCGADNFQYAPNETSSCCFFQITPDLCTPCKLHSRSFRQLERLVRQQNDYLTTIITSKTSETTNDKDEIESASSVLFEIILAAMDNYFI